VGDRDLEEPEHRDGDGGLMGNEVRCRAHAGKQRGEGKALLETTEIIFRGDEKAFRVKVPFAGLKKKAAAKDGRLELHTADGLVVLELGAQAEKWAEKINNPRSRADKLGVKPGQRVSVVGVADPDLRAELDGRGAVVTWGKIVKDSEVIFYGAARTADLGELRQLKGALVPAGALWIIRPKGGKDITEAQVMAAGKAAGLVDVKVVAFSATHTAEKYVIPVAARR
jgi:hypothetical protein